MTGVSDHRNNFNMIRLLAALQVLAVHALNHLGFEGPIVTALKVVPGVPTFFFISGLLICASYERMQHQGLRAFFTNRVLRIYPALWVCVAVSIVAVATTGYLRTQNFSTAHLVLWLLGQSSFLQFYNPEFMRAFGVGVINGALWTVTVELQFYALTPLLFFLMVGHRGWLVLVFVASLALNVYLRHYLDWGLLGVKLVYVSFLPWIYIFLLGFVAARYRDLAEQLKQRLRLRWLIPAYVLSMILVGPYEVNATNAINPISVAVLAACLLKLSTARLPVPERLTRFVARQDFSYGLYLYHMPVLNLVIYIGWFTAPGNLVTAFVGSVLAATVSWYLVEKPALRHKL